MGGAIARGLLASGVSPDGITMSNPTSARLAPFAALGVIVTSDNRAACAGAYVVILAVKPWIVPDVINEIKDTLDYTRQSVAVVAAGVSGENLSGWFDRDGALPCISIVMPNTAVSLRRSMTFIVPVAGDDLSAAAGLFGRLGQVRVIDEKMLPAATTLASCGIAYALRYIRAATEGGVELGFRASEAQAIVAQTVAGAAALLEDGAHAEAEIDKVTTPGGLTIRGLNEMEAGGFTTAVIRGLKAGMH